LGRERSIVDQPELWSPRAERPARLDAPRGLLPFPSTSWSGARSPRPPGDSLAAHGDRVGRGAALSTREHHQRRPIGPSCQGPHKGRPASLACPDVGGRMQPARQALITVAGAPYALGVSLPPARGAGSKDFFPRREAQGRNLVKLGRNFSDSVSLTRSAANRRAAGALLARL
jgi:hypothetical protein